ncbi:MAG: hypothetical protein V2J10_06920, partial [Wenzhouxiangella sp.]|nr:hypothetical protein [Wenzhouxiangella sp.]
MKTGKSKITLGTGLLILALCLPGLASAQESSITYQGQLEQSGEPFTGTANLQFRLYPQLTGGSQIGSQQTLQNVPIADGLFQVELDYEPADFDGGERYLEIRVNGTPLSPRQRVTATPYALIAATTAAGAVGGSAIDPSEVQLRVAGDCPAGRSIRRILEDGTVVCETDDIGEPGWSLGGNSGTDPSTDFIGTTDATALELRTANVRSLRIEPSAETFEGRPVTTNTIAGANVNEVLPGIRGATISGGGGPISDDEGNGDPDYFFVAPNRVMGNYGSISGGGNNRAGMDGGPALENSGQTVGGGFGNWASGSVSSIGGGFENLASGANSTIAGGSGNEASAGNSTVGGGSSNEASGGHSVVGGGRNNIASGARSFIGGGERNEVTGANGIIAGGSFNCVGGTASWAGGQNAKVRPGIGSEFFSLGCSLVPNSGDSDGDEGTFIWADSEDAEFVSTGPDQFLVRARGGVGFGGAPDDYFDIKSPVEFVSGDGVTENGVFRIRLNGATKFRVFANGGVGVGSSFSGPGTPQNGLSVFGNVQLGSLAPAGGDPLCL